MKTTTGKTNTATTRTRRNRRIMVYWACDHHTFEYHQPKTFEDWWCLEEIRSPDFSPSLDTACPACREIARAAKKSFGEPALGTRLPAMVFENETDFETLAAAAHSARISVLAVWLAYLREVDATYKSILRLRHAIRDEVVSQIEARLSNHYSRVRGEIMILMDLRDPRAWIRMERIRIYDVEEQMLAAESAASDD